MKKPTQTETEALFTQAKAEIQAIMLAPAKDPSAPDGYLTREFAEAETARRKREARAALDRLLYSFEERYGREVAQIVGNRLERIAEGILAENLPKDRR